MARLPIPGGDSGNWGSILNEFLRVRHQEDGRLKAVGLQDISGIINVKSFGAKGDGVADDTVAIQAAINNLLTTGGQVWLPAGTYSVSSQITVPSNVWIRGVGSATVVQRASGSDLVNGLFYLNGSTADVTDVCISDMKIDINGTTGLLTISNAFCIEMRAAGANRIRRCRVERCVLEDGWIGAISMVRAVECWATDNLIADSGTHTTVGATPITLFNATDCHVERNAFRDCMVVNANHNNSFLIDVDGASTRCIIAGNTVINAATSGQGTGVRVRGTSSACVVVNNVMDGFNRIGIWIEGAAVGDVVDTVVNGNKTRNCGREPVNTDPNFKEAATRTVVSGNDFSTSTTANNALESVGDDTTITGNVCCNITNMTNGTGLYLAGNRKSVMGNICNRNGLGGMTCENLHHSTIVGNTMLDNGNGTTGDGLKFSNAAGGVTYCLFYGNNIGDTRTGASRTQMLGFNNSLGGQPSTGTQMLWNLSQNNVTSDWEVI